MTVIIRSQVFVCLSLLAIPCLADERPNIVLIVADDLGCSDIGAFGGPGGNWSGSADVGGAEVGL